MHLRVVELCAGAGGQAIGLEQAKFKPVALIDDNKFACETLKTNRPQWNVLCQDLNTFDGRPFRGVDLLAGGLPCPPFSIAGQQLGENDSRNLFPATLRLVDEIRPKAIMIENVRGLLAPRFEEYRNRILGELYKIGYRGEWRLFNACDFGVSQNRARAVLVVICDELAHNFQWPEVIPQKPATVGERLYDLMAARGWRQVDSWSKQASSIAPTIVGGSLKHGGPDLGPVRAKREWLALGVDGHGLVDQPPSEEFIGNPRLTVQMVARLQGFPDDWIIYGKKTQAYRQVGNAFPPPVAYAIAEKIRLCFNNKQLPLGAGLPQDSMSKVID